MGRSRFRRASGRHRLLIVGDVHFGENYKSGGGGFDPDRRYRQGRAWLERFRSGADAFVANLETPLLCDTDKDSPHSGEKRWLHFGHATDVISALSDLDVSAVSLANNHSIDHGGSGLLETRDHLAAAGIGVFGAGATEGEARSPWVYDLPRSMGGGSLHFHGSFEYRPRYERDFSAYATRDRPGAFGLEADSLSDGVLRVGDRAGFHIAYPHWGPNYDWVSQRQQRLARSLFEAGADLVLGHGAHAVQEVQRRKRRWVCYGLGGLGNGLFHAPGRYARYYARNGIPPVSFWAIPSIDGLGRSRAMKLRLYPVYSDNKVTGYQPGPVTETDFFQLLSLLLSRNAKANYLANPYFGHDLDDLGHSLVLDLGSWSMGAPPGHLPSERRDRTVAGEPIRIDDRLASPPSWATPTDHRTEQPTAGVKPLSDDPGAWPSVIDRRFGDGTFNLSSHLLTLRCMEPGYEPTWHGKALFTIREGSTHHGFYITDSPATNRVSALLSKRKDLSISILGAAGLGVATGRIFAASQVEDAESFARDLGDSVVLKPVDAKPGRDVAVGVRAAPVFRELFAGILRGRCPVIVEREMQDAVEVPVLVVAEEAVAAFEKRPPAVVRDDVSPIERLVAHVNLERRKNPGTATKPIRLTASRLARLRENGLSPESDPEEGESVQIDTKASVSSGSDSVAFTDNLHASFEQVAVEAARAIGGLSSAGVDFLIRDPGQPALEGNYIICEPNCTPSIGSHTFPSVGEGRDVASAIVDEAIGIVRRGLA